MPQEPTSTSTLTLIQDDQAELQLDPVDAADTPESVAFDISFVWNMPFQQHRFAIRKCWFLNQSLRAFETQLGTLLNSTYGFASLKNMSDHPVLEVSLDGDNVSYIFTATDTTKLGKLRFTMNTYTLEIEHMYRQLRNYPKWW
ncbi:hypothetical protein KOR34_38750 [Posidoniimonas corsicana]|uniref:Uncharacterized protein n=1 Tax=Posidoniimonas corsicana TaxID=1938618 RepID=A0A5C5V836_9BACT|nr:hypothetical protein [Posidoniimonas corsicana]TWT34039.1 hypothetical protein KOR34_38750 [Posidoniimonas corsicana]